MSPFLQILKETGVRRSECYNLKWTDIDFKRRTVTIQPKKGSDHRIIPLSDKDLGMLKWISRNFERIFSTTDSVSANHYIQMKKHALIDSTILGS